MHGIFEQLPFHHVDSKSGCPKCRSNKLLTTEEFIAKAKNIFNEQYNYSLVDYKNKITKVKIICKKHGEFEINAGFHLSGMGCPRCGRKNSNIDDLIQKIKKIHNDKFDYSLISHTSGKKGKIKLICQKHGVFERHIRSILQNSGCPECINYSSIAEKKLLAFIKSVYSGNVLNNRRDVIKKFEIDIFLPDLKLAFEFNGIYWHSINNSFRNVKNDYHLIKTKLCEEKGINLIHVFEDDWNNKVDIVKSNILKLLGIIKKSTCKDFIIKKVDPKTKKDFLETNHIKGNKKSKINIAMFNKIDNSIMSICCFNKNKEKYSLTSFCDRLDFNFEDSLEIMLQYLKHEINTNFIVETEIDRSWSDKDRYLKANFALTKIKKPKLLFITKNKRYSQFSITSSCNKQKAFMLYNCGYFVMKKEFITNVLYFNPKDNAHRETAMIAETSEEHISNTKEVLSNEELRNSLSVNGRELMKRYTAEYWQDSFLSEI